MAKTALKYINGAIRYNILEIITSAFQLYFIAEHGRREISHGDARPSGVGSFDLRPLRLVVFCIVY